MVIILGVPSQERLGRETNARIAAINGILKGRVAAFKNVVFHELVSFNEERDWNIKDNCISASLEGGV